MLYRDKRNPTMYVWFIESWRSAGRWVCKYAVGSADGPLFIRTVEEFSEMYEPCV